jgi:hypothetical protein
VQILSTGTEFDLPYNSEWNKIRPYDETSNFCWGRQFLDNTNFTCLLAVDVIQPHPCCCSQAACKIGTFQSIFYVMKESMLPPHVLDLDWKLPNFTGNLTGGFLKSPFYLTENLIGFPLLFSKKLPTVKELPRFMNLEPFIPLCSFINKWLSKNPLWGTDPEKLLYSASFCTLFRPSNMLYNFIFFNYKC